jgi:hypothetical protein
VHEYLRRAVRFYNTLVALPAYSVYRAALKEDVDDGLTTSRPAPNFIAALYKALHLVMPRSLIAKLRQGEAIDLAAVEAQLKIKYKEHVTQLSHVVRGEGAKIGLYFREVARHELGVVPRSYSLHLPHGVLTRVLRFRLGSHHLRVNTGRWEKNAAGNKLERGQRTCRRCPDAAMVDDEAHCLFRCAYNRGAMPLAVWLGQSVGSPMLPAWWNDTVSVSNAPQVLRRQTHTHTHTCRSIDHHGADGSPQTSLASSGPALVRQPRYCQQYTRPSP